MLEPHWLDERRLLMALDVHYPGLHVIRGDGLAAALNAPIQAFFYGKENDIVGLAALYAERLVKAHAFADGNKRASAIACLTFLRINGVSVRIQALLLASSIESLAAGLLTTQEFSDFLRNHIFYYPGAKA